MRALETKKAEKKNKGLLLAFEGLSSAGKTVSLESFAEKILMHDEKVMIVKWNSLKVIRKISDFLYRVNLLTPSVYSLLQWKSFAINYFTKIRPGLRKGYIVLADRYIFTAYTRDSLNGISRSFTKRLYGFAETPDLILFFKIPPEICYARTKRSTKKIFHLCKRIHRSSEKGGNEVRYLGELHDKYLDVFNDKELTRESKIIFLGENWRIDSDIMLSEINERIPISYIEEINISIMQYMMQSINQV